ncbi:MAG: transglutaminase domain-containing protein [Spirochaetes bacterium]|nr:transglutaminase domain-containing protein [Spirochaetota bacterium]
MDTFLRHTDIIDWHSPEVKGKAEALAAPCADQRATARNCFLFVRDRILHSLDHCRNPVTLRASEVLRHGTGYCYAKSHLLAALLRANGIPAGICYQRLALEEPPGTFCLHALNAVCIDGIGWYRIDARGNKEGIFANFTPPIESLPYAAQGEGELDLPGVWADPLPVVVEALLGSSDYLSVRRQLPDLVPWQAGRKRLYTVPDPW